MAASKQKKTSKPEAADKNAPPVVINAQFIKDLSFENPNPLKNFTPTDKPPEFNINLELNVQQVGEHSYEVILDIKVNSHREKTTVYIAELEYAGVFTINNIPQEALHPFLMTQCPHYLFPFARSILAQVTTDAGFQPFLLNPIDFGGLYQQKMQEQAKGQKQ
jgi:preprotein translocase subunit SecB